MQIRWAISSDALAVELLGIAGTEFHKLTNNRTTISKVAVENGVIVGCIIFKMKKTRYDVWSLKGKLQAQIRLLKDLEAKLNKTRQQIEMVIDERDDQTREILTNLGYLGWPYEANSYIFGKCVEMSDECWESVQVGEAI